MVEGFRSCQPLLWLANKVINQIFSILGDILPVFMLVFELAFLHEPESFGVIISEEWWISTKKAIKDTAEAPHVAIKAIISIDDLRRNVEWRSASRVNFCQLALFGGTVFGLFWIHELGHAEVNHSKVRTGIFSFKQEVFRLEVAVGDTKLVAVVDWFDHLSEEVGGLLFIKCTLFEDPVKEFPALAELGDQINVAFTLKVLIEL